MSFCGTQAVLTQATCCPGIATLMTHLHTCRSSRHIERELPKLPFNLPHVLACCRLAQLQQFRRFRDTPAPEYSTVVSIRGGPPSWMSGRSVFMLLYPWASSPSPKQRSTLKGTNHLALY
jgi:hypothetical protein